jgi:serine protease AprX
VLAAVCLTLAGLVLSGSVPAGQSLPTLSADLRGPARKGQTHRVIVQADRWVLKLLRQQMPGFKRALKHAAVLEVSDDQLERLRRNPLLSHISGDLTVTGDMAVTNRVTGATSVWAGSTATRGYRGAGIGIAILDSGISAHEALDSRVLAHVNLVADDPGRVGDDFGHGTHVAGIAAGNRTAALEVTAAFSGGSAPSANLVDVRVLGPNGSGRTSDVIAGLEWAVDNRDAYNIRVINLSLGHPVTEPSRTDPLCQAVERAVAAGITVVVSAGNHGRTSDGAPVLGGITSPGNSPAALTVGAIDTKGTLDASDDVVAAYSSKGPAPFDVVVKPDVVAPGTRLVSLEAPRSYISASYPQWHIAGRGRNAYLRLSGTSMATAAVSGGVALLLNAAPSLTPAQVKAVLQMGARFMPADGLVAAGAGSVDFARSLTLAQSAMRWTAPVLSPADRPWSVAFRDDGTLIDRLYGRTGVQSLRLLDAPAFVRGADDAPSGVLRQLAGSSPFANTAPNYIVWGNSLARWSNSYYIVWGNTIATPTGQYIVWGNHEFSSGNYIVWGNSGGVR